MVKLPRSVSEYIMANNKLKSFKDVTFLTSLIYIILGVLLAVFKGSVISWAMTVAGVLLIVFGVVGIVKGNTIYGVIALLVGIVIIVCGWAIVDIAITILGIIVAIKGFVDLVEAFRLKKKNVLPIVYAIVTIAAGIMLAVAHWLVVDWFFIIVGILLIVDGIFGLLGKKIF